jgi:paraquat-inducible protein A
MDMIATNLYGLKACPACDQLVRDEPIPPGHKLRCARCGTSLNRNIRNSIDKTVATCLAALLLYIPAMCMPIMTFTVAGLKASGNVIDATITMLSGDYFFVGVMVLATSILFPFIRISLLFTVSFLLRIRKYPKILPLLFRTYHHLSEWGMVEVYLLGILVTIIKMHSMGDLSFNIGFFCFTALAFITAASSTVVDEDLFWREIEQGNDANGGVPTSSSGEAETLPKTAREAGLVRCHDCGKLARNQESAPDELARCPRCTAPLHMRKPNNIHRTWALVICSAVLFLPANILPIMRVEYLGSPDDSTIMDGIVYFFLDGDYAIGIIILAASVLVPLFKIVGIVILLLTIRFRWKGWLKHKISMFHFIEFVGRWSFLDIYVIALLSAMVRFGALTTIEAQPASTYFTLVVLTTMLGALAFDPRVLWDVSATQKNKRGTP